MGRHRCYIQKSDSSVCRAECYLSQAIITYKACSVSCIQFVAPVAVRHPCCPCQRVLREQRRLSIASPWQNISGDVTAIITWGAAFHLVNKVFSWWTEKWTVKQPWDLQDNLYNAEVVRNCSEQIPKILYGSVQSGILYDVQNEVLDAQDLHNCMSIYASALVFIKMYQLTLIIHHHEISAIYIYIYITCNYTQHMIIVIINEILITDTMNNI